MRPSPSQSHYFSTWHKLSDRQPGAWQEASQGTAHLLCPKAAKASLRRLLVSEWSPLCCAPIAGVHVHDVKKGSPCPRTCCRESALGSPGRGAQRLTSCNTSSRRRSCSDCSSACRAQARQAARDAVQVRQGRRLQEVQPLGSAHTQHRWEEQRLQVHGQPKWATTAGRAC